MAGEKVHLDASIGIAVLDPNEAMHLPAADMVDELVRRADNAMYRAKGTRATASGGAAPTRPSYEPS